MKLSDLREIYRKDLASFYSTEEIDRIFFIVSESILDKKISVLKLALHEEWAEFSSHKFLFLSFLEDLKIGKPYQYVLGEAYFYDLVFKVDKNVLIPRPETEQLIEWIVEDTPNKETPLSIIDLCTGSGCIGITLKNQFPSSKVSALDVSEKALEIAKTNATQNGLDLEFLERDLLDKTLNIGQTFDVIVSNPPYVRNLEKEKMEVNVLGFEPHLALFVQDENPLVFYQSICDFAKTHLSENGSVYVEINQYLPKETQTLFESYFEKVTLKNDLSGNARMIKATGLKS